MVVSSETWNILTKRLGIGACEWPDASMAQRGKFHTNVGKQNVRYCALFQNNRIRYAKLRNEK